MQDQRPAAMDLAHGKGVTPGFIDLFWPKVLIVEHKSKGKDLDSAFSQSAAYSARLNGIPAPNDHCQQSGLGDTDR